MAIDYNSAYTNCGNSINPSAAFTISTWLIFDGIPGVGNAMIMNNILSASSGYAVFLHATTTPDQIRLQCGDGTTWTFINIWWNVSWSNGEKHHIVITRDGTNYNMYEDGVLNTNKTETATSASNVSSSTTATSLAKQSTSTNYFQGKLWDTQLWDGRALSANECIHEYHSKGNAMNARSLECRYPQIEKSDGTTASGASSVKDYSINGNHGTPNASPTYSAQGVILI
jgi:hypothetical protein